MPLSGRLSALADAAEGAGAAIWVFFRMSDSGQFDDMEGPALRVLQDEDREGK